MSSSDDQFNDEVREKLKSMRANFDREMEEKRFEFLHDSYLLIKDLKRKTVDLRDIFRREEIDLLLTKSVDLYNEEGAKYSGASIITFVADSGYKDEPELDENGKPSSRRTTHVHRAHRLQCYDLLYDLFAIYNRFDVNYTDDLGLTHFHVACENGHTGVMKKFLEQGQVDPNLIATETGDAPLHFAMRSGDTEVIKLLLRNGADPNLANNEGSTPLHSRMIQLWFEGDRAEKTIFEICDEKQLRVQVDARDKLGNTPLHLALTNGRRGSTELLLRRDADPTSVNEKGETPLHIVCKGDKDDDLIELFFKICDEKNLKVDVNAKDSTDRTPLQWAVATLKLKVVNILMYRGADKSSFAFPTESHFDEAFKAFEKYEGHDLKLRLSSGFLATVKCLEKIGYKLELIDALTIMKLLVKYGMLRKSVDFVKRWHDDIGFTCRAQKIMIDSGLSIYDLLQLKFEEAAKRLTQVDCFKILEVANNWSQLLAGSGDPYREKLSEWLARAFVCRWGLDPVSELTRLQ